MPIVMSQKQWTRLQKKASSDQTDPEVARRREYINYLDTTSRQMTKSWPNSLENVNKRNEEQRQARIQAAEQANTKFYKRYLKRKKTEQERLMYSARDIVFKNRDAPKLLLSAVLETAVQKERMEQLKFLGERRREEAERKRQDDEDITRKAKEWHELMELRKKRRFEANKQHQKEIIAQCHEVSERNRLEYETELNFQKIDNVKAHKEIKAIEAFDKKFRAEEKARIFRDMERAKAAYQTRKREQAARDKMDDRLIEVLNRSRARVEAKRKKTELNMKNEKLRILEAISHKLESGDAAREEKELAILNKAIRQKNEVDEARRQDDIRKKEQFRKDRKEAREQFLRDEEQRLHKFNTMRQWEIMNRFKNAELYDNFKEQLRKENERKIKEYREDILKLWKEREDREARERAETRYFYGELAEKKIRDADNRLLMHAAHLLEECKQHQRPDFALRRTIDQYCKMHRLYPMPDLPKSLKEHFQHYAPWDGSKPDRDYQEPPEPPPSTPPKPLIKGPPTPKSGTAAPTPKSPPRPATTEPPAKPATTEPPAKPATSEPPAKPATSEPPAKPAAPELSAKPLAPKPPQKEEKRSGLQDMSKPAKSKPTESKQEKQSEDYKRIGPANGLQRRNATTADTLPPITVVPCKNPNCHCELKP